jgi:hypothetical protein
MTAADLSVFTSSSLTIGRPAGDSLREALRAAIQALRIIGAMRGRGQSNAGRFAAAC